MTEEEKDGLVFALETEIEDSACPDSTEVETCDVNILSLNGETVNEETAATSRMLYTLNPPSTIQVQASKRLRKLTSHLEVEFEIIIEAYCSVSDCSDAQDISNAVYAQANDELLAAINVDL